MDNQKELSGVPFLLISVYDSTPRDEYVHCSGEVIPRSGKEKFQYTGGVIKQRNCFVFLYPDFPVWDYSRISVIYCKRHVM